MELTYWTTLNEPRQCLRNDYPCKPHEQFVPTLNGVLTLKNVNVGNWQDSYNNDQRRD